MRGMDATGKILVLNGVNLGRLGRREPEIYGSTTHDQLAERLVALGRELGTEVEVRQTDFEGEMVGWLHEAADQGIPVVLNPAAWTHYSVAIADAVKMVDTVLEVHISNIHTREEFRHKSLVSPYARGAFIGLGLRGYELAIRFLVEEHPA